MPSPAGVTVKPGVANVGRGGNALFTAQFEDPFHGRDIVMKDQNIDDDPDSQRLGAGHIFQKLFRGNLGVVEGAKKGEPGNVGQGCERGKLLLEHGGVCLDFHEGHVSLMRQPGDIPDDVIV